MVKYTMFPLKNKLYSVQTLHNFAQYHNAQIEHN